MRRKANERLRALLHQKTVLKKGKIKMKREYTHPLRTLLLSALAVGLFVGLSTTSPAQSDLTFLSPTGQAVSLSSLRGKVVVLLFSGVQDPQCRDGLKALQSLAERYQGKDVLVYWVSINSANEASNEKIKAPCGAAGAVGILRDQGQSAFKRFGGKQLPTLVTLNKQGQLHGQPIGGFNPDADFINEVAAIVDGLLR